MLRGIGERLYAGFPVIGMRSGRIGSRGEVESGFFEIEFVFFDRIFFVSNFSREKGIDYFCNLGFRIFFIFVFLLKILFVIEVDR